MEKINPDSWPRKEIFDFFSGVACPYYSMTFTVDVTKAYAFAKGHGVSFYYTMCWLCTQAINQTEAFRYLLRDGELYRLDKRHPSFTDIKKGSDLFYIVTMPMEADPVSFCRAAAARSEAQDFFINYAGDTDDLVYLTCAPTLHITSLTNEHDSRTDDAIPRIGWGKFIERDGRKELNLSVEVNHRFIDGIHISQFAKALEELMEGLDT